MAEEKHLFRRFESNLYNIEKLCSTASNSATISHFIEILNHNFSANGFFPEYGGFDVGYSTITNSLLLSMKGIEKLEAAKKVSEVNSKIEPLLDEYGNYDSTETSRHTQFLYPFCFLFSKNNILDRIQKGIQANRTISPLWLDDRYCIGLAIDYLKVYIGPQVLLEYP